MIFKGDTVKLVWNGHSKEDKRRDFQDWTSLNTGQKYCRMLRGSILQYFRPALSNHLLLRPSIYLFLSGRLRQVWLYLLICTSPPIKFARIYMTSPDRQFFLAHHIEYSTFSTSFNNGYLVNLLHVRLKAWNLGRGGIVLFSKN